VIEAKSRRLTYRLDVLVYISTAIPPIRIRLLQNSSRIKAVELVDA